jgi:SprT-like family
MYKTREEYLTAAIGEVRPIFAAEGLTLPARIRVACGFPSTASRSGAVGQCWADTASADGHIEILISPVLDDPSRVMDVLIHELCHATPGAMNHGRAFGLAASRMGLVQAASSWKATIAGPEFQTLYGAIIQSLGPYPHASLAAGGPKKQSTRMLKAACPRCGYTVRLTAKWAGLGLPICPVDELEFTL